METEGKTISVIVPVYKTEAYLKRCVDSLRSQEYEGLEIILVDDGSPDGCPALCDAYAKEDGRIRVVHKENGGLVSAWQAGVKASRGAYLGFVDSDDWVEADMLTHMAAWLSGSREEIVCCNFVINRPNGATNHYHGLAAGIYEGARLEGEIKDNLLGHENRRISMSRCMKLFSRQLIEENMKYCDLRVTMGEDVNITLPALLDLYDAGMYGGIRALYRTVKEIYRVKGRESGKRQADREYVYLLLLAIKNEIRSGAAGFGKRTRQICKEKGNCRIVAVSDKANRMLYFVLRHPSWAAVMAVRAFFWIYDQRVWRT